MEKRLVSLFLCLCMMFPLLLVTVAAEQTDLTATVQTTHEKTENPFTDVKESDWFFSAVRHVFENGFFSGTSATRFEPNGTMTRGMFVTVLGRMAGVDTDM